MYTSIAHIKWKHKPCRLKKRGSEWKKKKSIKSVTCNKNTAPSEERISVRIRDTSLKQVLLTQNSYLDWKWPNCRSQITCVFLCPGVDCSCLIRHKAVSFRCLLSQYHTRSTLTARTGTVTGLQVCHSDSIHKEQKVTNWGFTCYSYAWAIRCAVVEGYGLV